MIHHNSIEQKLMIVEENGHSRPLHGGIEDNRLGTVPEDLLPSHINLGWRVKTMTPMGHSVLVLLEKNGNG